MEIERLVRRLLFLGLVKFSADPIPRGAELNKLFAICDEKRADDIKQKLRGIRSADVRFALLDELRQKRGREPA